MSVLLSADDVRRAIARIAHEIVERDRDPSRIALVGIRSRGDVLASRLRDAIRQNEGVELPLGALDITLYRDDLTRIGHAPIVRTTEIDFPVDDRIVVLVDDVLFTGRTIRAAMDALVDYGRPKAIRLAQHVLRGPAVVPESRLRGVRLELGQSRLPAREVKDAPRSIGSAPRGRGRARRPLVPGDPQVLEQDRTEFDQPQGRLAPDDDGVHAGTVAVVGADAAVAVAVERGGVAAVAAITFAGDQVDEGRFLSLLHESLTSAAARIRFATRGTTSGAKCRGGAGHRVGGSTEYRWRISPRQGGKWRTRSRERVRARWRSQGRR